MNASAEAHHETDAAVAKLDDLLDLVPKLREVLLRAEARGDRIPFEFEEVLHEMEAVIADLSKLSARQ